jgi:hypothetical protein
VKNNVWCLFFRPICWLCHTAQTTLHLCFIYPSHELYLNCIVFHCNNDTTFYFIKGTYYGYTFLCIVYLSINVLIPEYPLKPEIALRCSGIVSSSCYVQILRLMLILSADLLIMSYCTNNITLMFHISISWNTLRIFGHNTSCLLFPSW